MKRLSPARPGAGKSARSGSLRQRPPRAGRKAAARQQAEGQRWGQVLRRLSQANWLHQDRIIAWSGSLLICEVLFLGFLVLWQHDVFLPVPPQSSDFVSFYAAGKLVLAGTPALAYERAAHAAAEVAATMPGIPYQFFFYPPVYLLLCAGLALLPYMVAFVGFQVATLGVWLFVMRRILGCPGWAWCIPVLAYPAVFWTIGTGQNAFLTAALLGAATLLLDKRPVSAGVLLGLMCYKPHLGLLAPVALAVGGYWRTFTASAATVAALIGLSIGLFGLDIWQDYLVALAGSSAVYETGEVDLAGFITPYGAARVLGAGAGAAQTMQGLISLPVVALVGWIWRRHPGPAVRSAALAAGILLSVPLALIYELMLLSVAIAWLVRAGRASFFLPWEKLALSFCFLVPLVSRHLGQAAHIPLAPLAPAALLALCLVRTLRIAGGGTSASSVAAAMARP